MDRDDRLLPGVRDPVVAVQRCEQAGRVDHAAARQPGEAVLPGGLQLAAGERALVEAAESGEPLFQILVVGLG
jgi:hypothetical protein